MTVDSDCLLSNPLSSSVRAEVRINRSTAQYENKSQKFRGVDKQYGKQFHLTYSQRLHMLEPMIIQQAKQKFGQNVKVYKVSELREENQESRTEDILVVGTIFKQEENRPSILKEYAEQSEDKIGKGRRMVALLFLRLQIEQTSGHQTLILLNLRLHLLLAAQLQHLNHVLQLLNQGQTD